MKTLIIYGTKHGTTEKCSKLLKDKIKGEVVVVDIKKDEILDIASFDNIIIGTSIYMGQIQKRIKRFCTENINKLKEKRIGIFICGMSEKGTDELLSNSFPLELLDNASVKAYFGGELIFKKMNFFEKFIIKKVAKTSEDTSNLSEETINKFVNSINNK